MTTRKATLNRTLGTILELEEQDTLRLALQEAHVENILQLLSLREEDIDVLTYTNKEGT